MNYTYNDFMPELTPIFGNQVTLKRAGDEYHLVTCGSCLMKRTTGSCWVTVNVLGYPIAELKYIFDLTTKADKFLA